MAKEATHHDLTRRVHELAGDQGCRLEYTGHALKMMKEREISRLDVMRVLSSGFVRRWEINRGEDIWNVLGKDIDGRQIEVAVVAYEDRLVIKVITAF